MFRFLSCHTSFGRTVVLATFLDFQWKGLTDNSFVVHDAPSHNGINHHQPPAFFRLYKYVAKNSVCVVCHFHLARNTLQPLGSEGWLERTLPTKTFLFCLTQLTNLMLKNKFQRLVNNFLNFCGRMQPFLLKHVAHELSADKIIVLVDFNLDHKKSGQGFSFLYFFLKNFLNI